MIHVKHLILASTSATRQKMLKDAGLAFEAMAPALDERTLEQSWQGEAKGFHDLALHLARAKAAALSHSHPHAHVIGADQVLVCEGQLFHKASTIAEAHRTLNSLSGRTHQLHAAVCVCRQGQTVFEAMSTAHMRMWAFDEAYAGAYLTHCGDSILGSVGCYHYEGAGIRLFAQVDGDYHTILGLPLLPLLNVLREQGLHI